MPEPDRCVVPGEIRDYLMRDPEPASIALVVETADLSVSENRAMVSIYAKNLLVLKSSA
jgi:hypothetical protein